MIFGSNGQEVNDNDNTNENERTHFGQVTTMSIANIANSGKEGAPGPAMVQRAEYSFRSVTTWTCSRKINMEKWKQNGKNRGGGAGRSSNGEGLFYPSQRNGPCPHRHPHATNRSTNSQPHGRVVVGGWVSSPAGQNRRTVGHCGRTKLLLHAHRFDTLGDPIKLNANAKLQYLASMIHREIYGLCLFVWRTLPYCN